MSTVTSCSFPLSDSGPSDPLFISENLGNCNVISIPIQGISCLWGKGIVDELLLHFDFHVEEPSLVCHESGVLGGTQKMNIPSPRSNDPGSMYISMHLRKLW